MISLLTRHFRPVGPPEGPADPVMAGNKLHDALRADYAEWQAPYARTPSGSLPSGYRIRMEDEEMTLRFRP